MAEVTGGEAIRRLLDKVDVPGRIEEIKKDLPDAHGARRTALNRELKYLQALDAEGVKPSEAFVVSTMPVIPAAMRPVYADERGTLISSDINTLYRDVGAVNEKLKEVQDLPDRHKAALRQDLYDGVKAVQGLGDPISENPSLKGIFRQLSGRSSPKGGFFQGRVVRSRQNLSGRATITLGNDLDVDEVGLPEEMAWPLYRDFAVRELVGVGMRKLDALEAVKGRTAQAKVALEGAMSKRPLWLNRSPSLHRHSILAFNPVLRPGRSISINPLVTKGFNADFDGDQMAVHVPVSQEAVDEMKGKKPSDLLFSAGQDDLMMVPAQSSALGLFLMSKTKSSTPIGIYPDDEAALKALKEGRITAESTVRIAGNLTTPGRIQIDRWLPPKQRGSYGELDKKGLNRVLSEVAVERPKEYGKIVHGLRVLGDEHATRRGFSLGLDDLKPRRGLRDKHLEAADREMARRHARKGKTTREDFQDVYAAAASRIEQDLIRDLDDGVNSIGQMMKAGSRGSPAQARQILASPVLAQDHQGRVVMVPIRSSYADGLDETEYFSAAFGARAGAVGRSHQTSLPGALAKEVLASVADSVVSSESAGVLPKLDLPLDDPSDVLGRFLAAPVKKGIGDKVIFAKDTLVTPALVSEAKKRGVKQLPVYTPLNAYGPGGGIPARAYGVDAQGEVPKVGTNLGVLSGHALTEPISQMTLDAFHSGATGGTAGRISKFDRIKQLFALPDTLPGKATLSIAPGEVKKIGRSPVGGWEVDVDTGPGGWKRHYVDKENELTVKEGDRVYAGDRLSEGPVKPQELVALRGIEAAQDYLVNEIKKETGVNRRTAEVVVGAMTNQSRVIAADPLDDLVPGDLVPNHQVIGQRTKVVPVEQAVGRRTTKLLENFKTRDLTAGLVDLLKKDKEIDEVEIELAKPRVAAILKGVNMLPLIKADQDWVSGMGFRRLKEVISEGALRGRQSDIHSYSPVPALAYGAEFGLGKQGQY